mgnify:CR=1 FL=1
MPIHEKSLIRPENIKSHENLVLEGIDVSGHWSTFIETRVVSDYNERLQDEIAALSGGEYVHRCWQCGSCTNSCTVNAINPDFNPRYWIYLIRMGMESELLRDKDIIWQCVSCNKCTYACPRDVNPEGVMKATAHWLELKGFTEKKPSMVFDEVFSEQVFATGMIEDGKVLREFFARTKQPLFQDWLVALVRGPAYYDPYRHPKRALDRRNLVLREARDQHAITAEQYQVARATDLGLNSQRAMGTSPYPAFVDLVHRQLLSDYDEADLRSEGLRIFSTLDPRAQRAAEHALRFRLDPLGHDGEALPFVIQMLAVRHRIAHTPVAPLLVLAGGLALRFVFVGAGQLRTRIQAFLEMMGR